jgi:hypothetical protein
MGRLLQIHKYPIAGKTTIRSLAEKSLPLLYQEGEYSFTTIQTSASGVPVSAIIQ